MRRIVAAFIVLLAIAACAPKANWVPADGDSEEVPMVRFRKTFTAALPPNAKATDLESASREGERTVLVINATHLVDVLQQTKMFLANPVFDQWPWVGLADELGLQ